MNESETSVAFGRFRLDTRRRVLLADEQPVSLHARAFDVLEFLVAERDRIVTQQEITAHVWRGLVVGENNLRVQMSALRKTLADHGGEGLIINQVGRGYRFVGDVVAATAAPPGALPKQRAALAEVAAPAAAPYEQSVSSRPRRALQPIYLGTMLLLSCLLLGAGGVAWRAWRSRAAPLLSIAVLPFRNLSNDRAQDYMADAITDDLTTDLSHIPRSIVIARESADSFRDRTVPAAEIGRALNVRYLLEGSLRAEDGLYHVNAQLVEAATGTNLWTEQFDTRLARLTDVQTEIVRRIASALDFQLVDIESNRAARERPNDPDAVTLFLQARSIRERDDSFEGFVKAQALLEAALAKQPDFTEAMAELGLTLALKLVRTDDYSYATDWPRARNIVADALQRVPDSDVALAADARLREMDGDCDAAIASARKALAREPNSLEALAVLGKCYSVHARLDEAGAYIEQALRLNPESRTNTVLYASLAQIRLIQKRYEDAIDMANQAMVEDHGDPNGADNLGRTEYSRIVIISATDLKGDKDAARDLYRAYRQLCPHRSVWRIAAFSEGALTRLAGFLDFQRGLHDAGMPLFADEKEDDHVPPASLPHFGGDFDPTPLSVPGARTIDTAGLLTLSKPGTAVVIDVGRGAYVPKDASWVNLAPSDNDFIDTELAEQTRGNKQAPVIILGTGTFGYGSYNGALHAVATGYRNVWWYRGGEEAWAQANAPGNDRRPQ